jgi:trigger factor
MPISLERLENNRVALQVELAAEQVDEALDKAYHRVVRKVNIPGFRKGRAPRPILEARMGKEVLYEDALDILVSKAYPEAVKEAGIEPISKPEIDVVQLEQGKPLIFKVEVEVLPPVELGSYKGIEAEMPEVKVGDDEVEAQLQLLQQRHARLIDAGEAPAEDGDIVIFDFETIVDGKPEPRLTGKERSLEVGTHKFIPGFDAHLLGVTAGQELEFTMQLPSVFQIDELTGKEALFKVKATAVKHKELIPIDDEFARDVSDCSTLEELKAQLKHKLEEVGNINARRIFTERVVHQVVEQAEVEPPASLVEAQLQEEYGEFARNLSIQKLDINSYLRLVKKEPEALKVELQARAYEAVKSRLVLGAVAKAEGLKVSPEELDQELKDTAAQYGMDDARLRKSLEENGQLEAFERGLLLERVRQFLADNAKAAPPREPEAASTAADAAEGVSPREQPAGAPGGVAADAPQPAGNTEQLDLKAIEMQPAGNTEQPRLAGNTEQPRPDAEPQP